MTADTFRALAEQPVFFERNRVYRMTRGGALFHDLFGDEAVDTHYPEEWIASYVPATLNKGDPHEGISRIKGTDVYFDELLAAEPRRMLGDRPELGLLVKALDAATRLPVQVHPNKAFSRKHLNSDFGKTEAWLILATRGDASIAYGFEDQIDQETFLRHIEANERDVDALDALMHKIPVKPGDVFLVPSNVAHAIGENLLLIELQEPTDFTITPECWCDGHHLGDEEKYLGLPREIALQCFDYNIFGHRAEQIGRMRPEIVAENDEYRSESLIGYQHTPCFALNRHRVAGSMRLENAPAVFIVTQGDGRLRAGASEIAIHRGDYFFMPFALAGKWEIVRGSAPIDLIECLPPMK